MLKGKIAVVTGASLGDRQSDRGETCGRRRSRDH